MRIALWLFTFLLLFTLTTVPGPSVAGKNDQFEALRRFSQVLDMVESYYVKPISRKVLVEDAIKGLLNELDPHSAYLSPEDYKELQVSTSGKFSGIGIEISTENGRLIVVSPIEDTPAYKAGLKSGDIILEIDGTSTQDMTLTDAVKRIRGPKGTPVKLLILHKGENSPVLVPIVRGTIPIIAVKSQVLEDGYLYLRLTRFNENTTREMRKKISDYSNKAKLKGIILDLRNNPGGLLGQAVSVSDTFIKKGLITYIQGRDPKNRKDFYASNDTNKVDTPLVVLINSGSASASEIVAGALQDHNRALLVGDRSFGKGSVQTIIPLTSDSGIKLTTALYYTPNGRSIQATGIQPDLAVPFVRNTETKKDKLRKSMLVREGDLSGHLKNANGSKVESNKNGSTKAADMLKKDNQLRLGLELVKKLPRLSMIK